MRPPILAFFIVLTALLPLGCLDAVRDELSAEDEPSEVASRPLPLEDSPVAYGMLRVVNELGFDALDLEVGLDRRAARSILEWRAGSDRYIETGDDRYVSSIAQLDALHWLGENNLWDIQRYALRQGMVLGELPEPRCAAALTAVIDQCLRFTRQAAQGEVSMDDLVPSCLEQSEPVCPSSAFFAASGLIAHDDPMLGYHALLCEDGGSDDLCDLGVAGLAAYVGAHCDARYDIE